MTEDPNAPKRTALVVRGFVSAIVFDPQNYTDPVFTAIESETAERGQRWTGTEFVDPVYRRHAQVRDGVVANVCDAAEGFDAGDGSEFIPSDTAKTGDLYEDGEFTTPEPDPVTTEQVNAERDRRFELGFYFNGALFQSDRDSRENVAGAGTMSLGAMVAGKQPGDLRWAIPDRDFTWTAADNSQFPMDAQTAFAFAASLGVRKEAFIKAAQAIKAMDPIPVDYASNDTYWPALEP